MILVLTGTNPYSFERMVKAADSYAEQTIERMFIQLGNTAYRPINADYERFLPRKELLKLIEYADLIITQGGFGSIADCLIADKTVIAVPRKPELNESPDDQEELVKQLEQQGRILAVYDTAMLPQMILKAKHFHCRRSGNHIVPQVINRFIEKF